MKVNVQSDRGALRLRWIFEGKRYSLSLGLPDSPLGRAIAKQRAAIIEQDIYIGKFDKTLLQYRPKVLGANPSELSCPELFDRFMQSRRNDLQAGSLARYKGCLSNVRRYLNQSAHNLSPVEAENFRATLSEHLSNSTVKAYLHLLSACFSWADGKFHVPDKNPFSGQAAKIKGGHPPKLKPFSEGEIRLILEGFKSDRYYSHYYPVVRFLFAVGCRPGEAFGLHWRNVGEDFRTVTFCEGASKGKPRQTTKTGHSRVVQLPDGIAEMLRSQAKDSTPQDLVFPSPQGLIINDHTFRKRAWKSVLGRVGVPYRKLYGTRHTVASHAIAQGANYLEVAEQLGHDPQVLHDHYVSAINRQVVFKEFS